MFMQRQEYWPGRSLMARIIFPVAVLTLCFPLGSQDPHGCFTSSAEARYAVIPPYIEHPQNAGTPAVIVTIFPKDIIARVSKYIFGNNANTYMTQMVTEQVLLEHIRRLSPNIIRYPGGNLSSVFFWNSPKDQPPADAPAQIMDADGNMVNPGYWYGRNSESWTLSVDNYYEMLSQTNSTGMITINYGYARYGTGPAPAIQAAHYAADWVRYDNGRTLFWEIGNESSGPWQAGFRINKAVNQDNQPEIITGELYGEHFNIFVDSMKAAAAEKGHEIFIGAQVIPYDASGSWNPPERTWNNGFFSVAGNKADFFIVHSYYTPYDQNSSPSIILNSATTETANMMNYLKTYTSGRGIDMKPVALTEWNIFAVGSKQSCSFINGMHAAIVLGELIKHQYGQASRWDLANGYDNGNDHGMFNKGDEPGVPPWNPRPVFFYMYYFQKFCGDHMVRSVVSGDDNILAYATRFASGETGVIVVNKGSAATTVRLYMPGFGYGERYYMYCLTGGSDNSPFSQCVYVNDHAPDNLTGGPVNDLETLEAWSETIIKPVVFSSPAYSVHYILIDDGANFIDNVPAETMDRPLIYPNPASELVSIHSAIPIETMELIRMDGTIIQSAAPRSCSHVLMLDPSIPPGIYLLRSRHQQGQVVEKLVVY